MTYGYARVSSIDQNLERQLSEFQKFGIPARRIFADKKSGRDFCRDAYCKLVKKLKAGDLLVIKSIDRLGRNYVMITAEWNRITNVIGADILVLDMPLLDTRAKNDSLMGKFISDVVLQVLSFVAENERVNIKARQMEGIRLAKEKGVRFGRPNRKLPKSFKKVFEDYRDKRISLAQAVSLTGLETSLFYYYLKKANCQRK